MKNLSFLPIYILSKHNDDLRGYGWRQISKDGDRKLALFLRLKRVLCLAGRNMSDIDWETASTNKNNRDTLEISAVWEDEIFLSENYNDISAIVRRVGEWNTEAVYEIANETMQKYYEDIFDESTVGDLFCSCYLKCIAKKEYSDAYGETKLEMLGKIYEYFCRANARKSVAQNEAEGRTLVEQCGLSWSGTTYYNSKYYYACRKMQKNFCMLCDEICDEWGMHGLQFEEIESHSRFRPVGGMKFHGVFVWTQMKDNYPCNQYGFKNQCKEPPQHFVYLYRNHLKEEEYKAIEQLGMRLKESVEVSVLPKERRLWRSFLLSGDRDYHNGMSYLLEGRLQDAQDEKLYCDAMNFLENFRLYRLSGCVEYLYAYQKD